MALIAMQTILLKTRELAGPRPGPHLLITGGIHGDEFEAMAAIRELADRVEGRLLRGRLTLVPVVNEPAFLRGARTGEDNLDLARTCPGRPDGSITERLAAALSEWIRSADYYIDLHSGGTAMRVLPLAGYVLHPQEDVLTRQRQMARAFNLPIVWGTSAGLEGRSLSVARDANVPAIYAEYLGAGQCDRHGVQAYIDGCLNVMAWLEMLDRDLPPSAVEHVVEDSRESSGHMQICHPAPMAGFFTAQVELGQRVRRGDVLGAVCDLLGTQAATVRCQHDGIVLVLRTFSRVLEGESLGVILETDRGRPR